MSVVAHESSSEHDLQPRGFGRWAPTLLGGIWLVYMSQPLSVIADHEDGPARDLGLVAVAAFCLTYLVIFARLRMRRAMPRSMQAFRADALMLVLIAGLVLCTALMVPAAGGNALSGLVYVAASVMMVAPVAIAWVVNAGLLIVCEVSALLVDGWQSQAGNGLGVLLASTAVFGLRMAIQRNRQLLVAREDLARLAVADERARLARDLHDILGHSLTVITVKAELAGRLAESEGAARARAEIGDVEQLAREALADVRSALGGIRGITLAGELAGARTALDAAGIRANLPSSVDDVPPTWRELFAWTVREGVTNVVRHSQAGECIVRLSPRAVEVVDDGLGPPSAAAASADGAGHGLAGLRERARQQGATLIIGHSAQTAQGSGFRLRVEVPA